MPAHPIKNNYKLENEIIAELENGHVIIVPQGSIILSTVFIKILNRMRRWHTRFFRLKPPTIGSGNKELLTSAEAAAYDVFNDQRKKYRKLNYNYADQYRGGYILNYFLAIYAVTLAVVSILLLYFGAKAHSFMNIAHPLVLVLGVIKFLILLLILANTLQANKIEFNLRAISARYVIELFRSMSYLALFNIHRLPATEEKQYLKKKLKEDHLDIFARDALRVCFGKLEEKAHKKSVVINFAERLPSLLLFIQADWIQPQIEYHQQKLSTQNTLDERLEKQVNIFNAVVLFAVGFDIIVGICDICSVFKGLPTFLKDASHLFITPVILASAAIIPALVAALNGLKFQTETRKLAERAAVMTERLGYLNKEYNDLIDRINKSGDAADNVGSFTQEAITLVTDSCKVMVDEVTDWMFVYRKEVLES